MRGKFTVGDVSVVILSSVCGGTRGQIIHKSHLSTSPESREENTCLCYFLQIRGGLP
ncbi:rCG44519 [Rattus norvegicus]|uniref:RCG44519 n=1 Tax=Rattus norvegicus TaxID=10116 RepID=A6I5D2_RAT|nr:rCG44519 [Rattus norvegicus]